MDKSILLSIRPKWVEKILNGEKTIEIRKKFPKDYVGWVYIYCTKDKKYANLINRGGFLTGMVVARFWCDEVLPIIKVIERCGLYYYTCQTKQFYYNPDKLTFQSCLSTNQIRDYLGDKNGFAIHFSTLEIFDKPKEISEFRYAVCPKTNCEYCEYNKTVEGDLYCTRKTLTKAPQSWCYVEVSL